MAEFDLNFDATQVDPRQSEGGVCFPLADYVMEIVGADYKAAADSTAENPKGMLIIKLKCIAGQMAGQVQLDRLNIWNPSAKAVEIARQQLSAYAHIGGKPRIGKNSELLGIKLIATIGPQDDNPKYSDVKVRKDLAGNTPVWNQPCAPQTTQPQVQDAPPVSAAPATTSTASPFTNPAASTALPTPQGNTASAPPSGAWANSAPAGQASGAPPWANK